MVALHTPGLVRVQVDDDLVVMGMLADRRDELGRARTQTINRLHRLLLARCVQERELHEQDRVIRRRHGITWRRWRHGIIGHRWRCSGRVHRTRIVRNHR